MQSVFDWKVIRARLSRSQALTHLAALSIAMELVAMAAEKVLTATQQACCALRAPGRACSFFCPSSFIVRWLFIVCCPLCVLRE